MRKGDRVEINNTAKYDGQDMAWTETPTHRVHLKKGDRIFHKSSTKLNSFLAKETCFYSDDYNETEGFIYMAILKKDITVQGYSNDSEIRLELDSEIVDLYYLGSCELKRTDTKKLNNRGQWVTQYKWIDRTIKIN